MLASKNDSWFHLVGFQSASLGEWAMKVENYKGCKSILILDGNKKKHLFEQKELQPRRHRFK